jgi:hypothetical protein
MPAVANGVANAANTPVMFRFKGPRTASADHGASAVTSEGTLATSQTTDSSVGVRVTEKKVPFTTQGGSESPGDMRHIAYEPATGSRVSLGPWSATFMLCSYESGSRAHTQPGVRRSAKNSSHEVHEELFATKITKTVCRLFQKGQRSHTGPTQRLRVSGGAPRPGLRQMKRRLGAGLQP